MDLVGYIRKKKINYVINKANNTILPGFQPSPVTRKHITFTGLVQGVGFRREAAIIAGRLRLTGWIKNREDGSVETEIQGEQEKINFLVDNMKSLKRAYVSNIINDEMSLDENEMDFTIIRR